MLIFFNRVLILCTHIVCDSCRILILIRFTPFFNLMEACNFKRSTIMWRFIEFARCFYNWSFEVFRHFKIFIGMNLASLNFTLFYSIFMLGKQYVCKVYNVISLRIRGCYRLLVCIRFFLLFLSLGLNSHEWQAFSDWRRRWRFPFSSTLTSLPPHFTIFKWPWKLFLVVLLYSCWGLTRSSPTLVILFASLLSQLCQSHSWLFCLFKICLTNRLCW